MRRLFDKIPLSLAAAVAAACLLAGCSSKPYADFNSGLRAIEQGDETQAETLLLKSLTEEPDNSEAWNQLGILAFERGHWSLARERFSAAAKLNPLSAVYTRNLALGFAAAGDYAEAESLLMQAWRLDPGDAHTAAELARLAVLAREYDKAREWADRAIELMPGHTAALDALSRLPSSGE